MLLPRIGCGAALPSFLSVWISSRSLLVPLLSPDPISLPPSFLAPSASTRLGSPCNRQEVCICFGGRLLRGNRSQKVNSSAYQAFDSPDYPHLATLGVDVEWKEQYLLRDRRDPRPSMATGSSRATAHQNVLVFRRVRLPNVCLSGFPPSLLQGGLPATFQAKPQRDPGADCTRLRP